MENDGAEVNGFDPQPKKKNKGGRPRKHPAPPPPTMGNEQLMQMFTNLVGEMKKPTVLEQAKLDETAKQQEKLRAMKIEAARREIEYRKGIQDYCPHTNPHGKHTFVGQVCSDGFIHGVCQICHWEFPKIKATDSEKQTGANLQARKGLSRPVLERWAQTSQMMVSA